MGLFSGLRAAKDVEKIMQGGTAFLSIAEITNLIINLVDAKKNLSSEEFDMVAQIYSQLQECNDRVEMGISKYYDVAAKILKIFDAVAPCESYLGMNKIDAMLLMNHVRNL